MFQKNKGLANWLVLGIPVLLMLLGYGWGLFENMELSAYDMQFRWRGEETPPDDVVIIAIDDPSIAELGPLAWPRQIHAKLMETLRGAKVVAFDLIFDSKKETAQDKLLEAAFQQQERVVLASQFIFQQEKGETYYVLRQPLPEFLGSGAGSGFVNFPTDQDNTARRVVPADMTYFERPYPSFSLAIAMAEKGLSPDDLQVDSEGVLRAGDLEIPINQEGQVLLNFWGPAGAFTTYSYIDVLQGRVSRDAFKNKIVLIGVASPAEQDYFNTPFTRGNLVLSGSLPSFGVELHASALESIRQGIFFHRLGRGWNLAGILVLAAMAVFGGRRRHSWQGLIIAIGTALAWIMTVRLLWLQGLWLDLAAPVFTLAIVYLVTTVANLIETEMDRRRVQGLFGRYVNETVVAELLRQPEMLELGGKRQDVTILFSDIRGFTSYSEGKAPEQVMERLNEYLAAMTEIILDNGGMLDKYLGDGIMAVFGAPLTMPDHANRALRAAGEMLQKLEELNQLWKDRGEPTFEIGIGLNSGAVLVGNVGGRRRTEYTVIGEEVNLASRLESMNKEHHTKVIISARTMACLDPGELPWSFVPLGEVQVRGLVLPVEIFTMLDYSVGNVSAAKE